MYFIKNESLNPRFNLALEEYVLKYLETKGIFIILWQNEPSVIIGRFQNTFEEVNIDFVKKNKINVIRRITGGGAVYHDLGNLNFSFIEKAKSKNIDFKKYNERIIKALDKLGIKAELNSRNDIAIDGKKFSGNAQYIYKDKVLHHGTILYNSNLNDLEKALNVETEKFESKGVKSVRSRVTNIVDHLQNKVSIKEFKDILLKCLTEGYQAKEYRLKENDLKGINQLMKEKYNTWEWNYGSSPDFNFKNTQRFSCGKVDVRIYVEEGFIKNIKIYGDFFGSKSIEEIENLLTGVEYNFFKIKEKITGLDLEKYFGKITINEFLSLFSNHG